MGERRTLGTERVEQKGLLWRVAEVAHPPHDVSDTHVYVVDDDGEVIRRAAVGAPDDKIVYIGRRN